ncbi:MAG: glycosyltransferase family 39 protein [Janthinobacterium lividum]
MNFFLDKEKPLGRKLFWGCGLLICLVGVVLRLPSLGSRSLWIDEAYSYWFASRPLSELWHQVPLYETHPPMYYTLLNGWMHLFGSSEFGMRSMSVAVSVATILLLLLGAKWLRVGPVGERIALVAAVLLAVNKGSIQYAQQARPYALETLAVQIAVLCSLLALQYFYTRRSVAGQVTQQTAATGLPYASLVGLAVGAGLTLWSHNTATLIFFSIWVGLMLSLRTCFPANRLKLAVIVTVPLFIAGLFWTPFIHFLLIQSATVKNGFWITFSWVEFSSAWVLLAGGKLPLLPMFVLCVIGCIALWRSVRYAAVFLLTALLLPYLLTIVISYTLRPIYIQRLFEWMCPEITVLAAIGLMVACKTVRLRQGVLLLVVVLSLIQSALFLKAPSEDWHSTIDYIAAHAQPGDLLIISPNESQPAVEYYKRNMAHFPDMLEVPAAFPALGLKGRSYRANLGAPSISEADRPLLREAIAAHKRVWLIERGADEYDPSNIVKSEISAVRKLQPLDIKDVVPFSLYE